MAISQNSWPANDVNLTKIWTIPNTSRRIRLEKGDAGYLLCHFASWFDKYVEDIDPEDQQLDDWGYAERPIRGGTALSNHASGTAIDLNALKHPLGVSGTFTATQAAKIRAKLHQYEGCIRWGGDYSGRKDEMHFEINASSAKVSQVANKLRETPSQPIRRGENMLLPIQLPSGEHERRMVIPVGKASAIVERAWISFAIEGPLPGRVRAWYQGESHGIADSSEGGKYKDGWRFLSYRDGMSSRWVAELPSGTVQVNIQYEFPDGGTLTLETLAK